MAKKNDAAPKGAAPSCNADNTPRHKLLAMGQTPKVAAEGKKTPA